MSLSKLLPNVGETLTVNRASRSHARKVRKKWFQKWILILHDSGAILGV